LHGFLLPGKNLQWKPSIRSQVSQVTNDDKFFYGMGHNRLSRIRAHTLLDPR
jgi:hypothetical protein